MFILLLSSAYKEAILSVSLVTLLFLTHHFVLATGKTDNWFRGRFSPAGSAVRQVIFSRFFAVFLFGLVPVAVILFIPGAGISDYGVSERITLIDFVYILPLSALIIPLNYFNAKTRDNLRVYPQIRISAWNYQILLLSALTWITYLAAYEFMFRGFLLFSCIRSLDAPAAITINISLYALVHLPKGMKEALSAIPFGIILCLLVIKLGSVWPAIIVHSILALSNEWFALAAHPDMAVVNQQKRQ